MSMARLSPSSARGVGTRSSTRSGRRSRPTLPKTTRDAVDARSGGLCEGILPNGHPCRSPQNLQKHHIIPKRMGGRGVLIAKALDLPWNILNTCEQCHRRCQGTYKVTFGDLEQLKKEVETLGHKE